MKHSSFLKKLYAAGAWSAVSLLAASAMAIVVVGSLTFSRNAKAQTPAASPPSASTPAKPPMMEGGGHHGMRGMHGGGAGMGMMGGGMPERMLWAIDATPEQRAKLKALGESFQADMKPMHEQMRAHRQQGMALFSAATLDKAAIEKQRIEHLALHDKMSKRIVAHMTDSAEVLTPAQRSKIAQGMKSRMEGRGGHQGQHGFRGHFNR